MKFKNYSDWEDHYLDLSFEKQEDFILETILKKFPLNFLNEEDFVFYLEENLNIFSVEKLAQVVDILEDYNSTKFSNIVLDVANMNILQLLHFEPKAAEKVVFQTLTSLKVFTNEIPNYWYYKLLGYNDWFNEGITKILSVDTEKIEEDTKSAVEDFLFTTILEKVFTEAIDNNHLDEEKLKEIDNNDYSLNAEYLDAIKIVFSNDLAKIQQTLNNEKEKTNVYFAVVFHLVIKGLLKRGLPLGIINYMEQNMQEFWLSEEDNTIDFSPSLEKLDNQLILFYHPLEGGSLANLFFVWMLPAIYDILFENNIVNQEDVDLVKKLTIDIKTILLKQDIGIIGDMLPFYTLPKPNSYSLEEYEAEKFIFTKCYDEVETFEIHEIANLPESKCVPYFMEILMNEDANFKFQKIISLEGDVDNIFDIFNDLNNDFLDISKN